MLKLTQIKILILLTALGSAFVCYAEYVHWRALTPLQRRTLLRPMSADEKRAQPSGFAEALKKH